MVVSDDFMFKNFDELLILLKIIFGSFGLVGFTNLLKYKTLVSGISPEKAKIVLSVGKVMVCFWDS